MPKIGGGRLPALEMLFNDIKPISDSILAGNSIGIKIGMQQDSSQSFIFEKYLFDIYKKEIITYETARDFSSEPAILDQMKLGTYTPPSLDSMLHR
jgi:Tfp pilus assembly ATPase PilU